MWTITQIFRTVFKRWRLLLKESTRPLRNWSFLGISTVFAVKINESEPGKIVGSATNLTNPWKYFRKYSKLFRILALIQSFKDVLISWNETKKCFDVTRIYWKLDTKLYYSVLKQIKRSLYTLQAPLFLQKFFLLKFEYETSSTLRLLRRVERCEKRTAWMLRFCVMRFFD